MKNIKSLLIAAMVLIIGMISCKKGDTGPAGPQGPAGPDSVVYSDWIPLSFTYVATDTAFEDTILAPTITEGILDSGAILSYIQFTDQNNDKHIEPMASLGNIVFEDFSVGKINFFSFQVDLSGYLYRYVTIPGSKKTNSTTIKVKGYTIQELKAMPYEQAQQVLSEKN